MQIKSFLMGMACCALIFVSVQLLTKNVNAQQSTSEAGPGRYEMNVMDSYVLRMDTRTGKIERIIPATKGGGPGVWKNVSTRGD